MDRLLCAFLMCVVASIGAASGKGVKAPASPTTSAKASALLENASWYRDAQDYATAEKLILEALETAPDNEQIKSQGKSLWEEVRKASQLKQTADEAAKKTKEDEDLQKTNNQLAAQLDEAKRLSAQGKNDEASQAVLSVLKETDDPTLVLEAKNILANNQPSAVGLVRVIPQRLFTIGAWVLDFALAIILVVLLVLFLPILRRAYSYCRRYSWRKAFQDWRDRKRWRVLIAFVKNDRRQARVDRKAAGKADNFLASALDRESWRKTFKGWRDHKGSPDFFSFLKDSRVKYERWFFRGVEESSKLGVGEAVMDSIKRLSEAQPTPYADLLLMERMKVEPVLFEFSEVHVDPLPALEALNFQIGGVTLGGIAKALSTLQAWISAKDLWIRGTAIGDDMITVRLTRRNADDTSLTVAASGEKTKVSDLAEAVTYMMFYSLAKSSNLSDVDAANKLREGRDLLGQYVSGQDPNQLEAAYKVFRSVRVERPTFEEVYLYEGIALELLEQHDEAIKRFQYLKNSTDAGLRNKAKYNEAVSQFRTYRDKDAFSESIRIFDELLELPLDEKLDADAPNSLAALVDSPLKTLALATKANVIAHQSIFWRDYLPVPNPAEPEPLPKEEPEARAIRLGKRLIQEWIGEVKTLSTFLESVLKSLEEIPKRKLEADGWDDATRQEVKWAIENAYGNVYLNSAVNFLIVPEAADEPKQRLHYFEQAYWYFQECEMLLPAGVETLTNLATTLLGLCREDRERYSYDQVRAYLTQAKEVNPHYEYADYRLAQSWEQEGRIDEVVRVLRAYAKERTPTSKGFKELYRKYSLELAKFPGEPVEPQALDTASAQPPSPSA